MELIMNKELFDKIPESHECKRCGKGKYETTFGVYKSPHNQQPYYVRNVCHFCHNSERKPEVIPKEIRRETFREKWNKMEWRK